MTTKILLAKTFLTFLVLLVPYAMYVGSTHITRIPSWVGYVGLFLMGGTALTFFGGVMVAIWE